MEQLEYVRSLGLRLNEEHRGNCPFCGGGNTFTAVNLGSKYKWNCYKANCTVSGSTSKSLSTEELNHVLVPKRGATEDTVLRPFSVPDSFVSLLSSTKALDYARAFNCLTAYTEGRADLRYDVRTDRVVFVIHSGETLVDAVGRALTKGTKPKWLRYAKSQHPFMCRPHAAAPAGVTVIVEDAASACAVSAAGAGVALLGTSLLDEYIPSIVSETTKLVIALDKDASKKAFDIQRELSYYTDTKIWLLEDDIKYLNQEFIKKKVDQL
jgi:hypothetical protein